MNWTDRMKGLSLLRARPPRQFLDKTNATCNPSGETKS